VGGIDMSERPSQVRLLWSPPIAGMARRALAKARPRGGTDVVGFLVSRLRKGVVGPACRRSRIFAQCARAASRRNDGDEAARAETRRRRRGRRREGALGRRLSSAGPHGGRAHRAQRRAHLIGGRGGSRFWPGADVSDDPQRGLPFDPSIPVALACPRRPKTNGATDCEGRVGVGASPVPGAVQADASLPELVQRDS